MNAKEMIGHLERTGDYLGKVSCDPKNYNTDYAFYLEQAGWELHRMANTLKEISELGVFFHDVR